MSNYYYTNTDFKSTSSVDIIDLQNQITNSSISGVQYINYAQDNKSSNFSVDIYFAAPLSSEDEAALDLLIENYVYIYYSNISALLLDERAPGTNGGTFTSGSWQTRPINTIRGDQNFCTLNNNQFTLQAGSYIIEVNATAYGVRNHQMRLRNITNQTTTITSQNGFTTQSNDSLSIAITLNLDDTTTFEVQHQCSNTFEGYGFGLAAGFGEPEVYCYIMIHNNGN